jgi:hypothetical protein
MDDDCGRTHDSGSDDDAQHGQGATGYGQLLGAVIKSAMSTNRLSPQQAEPSIEPPWHRIPAAEVARLLASDLETGVDLDRGTGSAPAIRSEYAHVRFWALRAVHPGRAVQEPDRRPAGAFFGI